uniref:Bcl-2 Bcl-2 homology region 1-3 domain-containing protein n=1 Tax=Leptobrachium leishanense TaxID=445787 RepID=A0A8C5QRL7_9ANUR
MNGAGHFVVAGLFCDGRGTCCLSGALLRFSWIFPMFCSICPPSRFPGGLSCRRVSLRLAHYMKLLYKGRRCLCRPAPLHGMLTKLSIQQAEDLQKLSEVPSLVFNDGITNWGRIVTLISFGAFLAKHLQSIKLEDCIVPLADNFTDYLMTSKREWIMQQKSWDGFVEFFHVEDYESGLRTVLMTFAGVAGIGASLAYMIR